jgi:fido (protein-threonine AMPylation protein)
VAAAEQFQVSQMERQIAGLTFSKVLSTLESFLWSTHPKLLNFENVCQVWRPTPENSQMPASSPMWYQATNSQSVLYTVTVCSKCTRALTFENISCLAVNVVTAHERALKEMLSLKGHLTVEQLCRVHALLCAGQGLKELGMLRSVNVKAGKHKFCNPALVRQRLEAFVAMANRLAEAAETVPCAELAAAVVVLQCNYIHAFRDGNGRLARIMCNWMLQRCGVPFVICLCSSQDQRQRYVASVVGVQDASLQLGRERRALLASSSNENAGFRERLVAEARIMRPLEEALSEAVNLVHAHTKRAWEELERLRLRLLRDASDASAAAALRESRREQRASNCMICHEERPNIATLCCGAAVHLNCMAKWLADAPQPACINCREALPRALPRQASGHDDETTSTSSEQYETTTSTGSREDAGGSEGGRSPSESPDETTSTTSDTDEDDNSSTTDETTTSDTTANPALSRALDSRGQGGRRPRCGLCMNVAASACSNKCCGSCCLQYGSIFCLRHRA